MTITSLPINAEIEWEINNTSNLIGEETYLKGDFIDEPSLHITPTIKFSDNEWHFFDEIYKKIKFDFSAIKSKIFRVFSKKIVLRHMFYLGKRNITVKKLSLNINRFIQFLEKEKYMYNLIYFTPEIIKEYMDNYMKKGITKQYMLNQLDSIGELLKETKMAGYEIDLSQYQKVLNSISWEEIKAEIAVNRTPNIPNRIFKEIVFTALTDMDDVNLEIEDKMMACLIVILCHTGMRKGELQLLEANKLKDITVLNKEEKAYILEFITYKTTGTKKGRWTKTIAFSNTIKAYKTLENLSAERRVKGKTNYLFLNKKGSKYSNTAFVDMFDLFFYRHQELFNDLTEYERTQVQCLKVGSFLMGYLHRRKFSDSFIGREFFTLNAHQFRVAIANILKNKVGLQWIREHMNHLDEEMTKHYFRDDEIIKETLYKSASVDGNSLEFDSETSKSSLIINEFSESKLQKAYKDINKFLQKKKLNIFKDIDQIINTLKYNPLRESIVGVCTKHIGLLCERQYRLATLEKWYYLSPTIPNIESFDFTYKRFLDKAKIVQHNKKLVQQDTKYQRDYENEYIALSKFYQNRLLPEYELIKAKLKSEGIKSFVSSFPQLEEIITHIDEIEKEISKWSSKLTLENL